MMVIPAIDLMQGNGVRLAEGDRDRATVYSNEPHELARRFVNAGARRVHVVDLDGAFAGHPVQLELVGRVIETVHAHGGVVEVGGGIRTRRAALQLLDLGADFVVLGTMTVREPDVASSLCHDYPGRVIVAVDGRNGKVAVDGWREDSDVDVLELGRVAQTWGAAALLFTDVSRDGLQVGPAVEATSRLQAAVAIDVIASGGVGSLDDLLHLRDAGVRAVVLGRALYEGSVGLEEALSRC